MTPMASQMVDSISPERDGGPLQRPPAAGVSTALTKVVSGRPGSRGSRRPATAVTCGHRRCRCHACRRRSLVLFHPAVTGGVSRHERVELALPTVPGGGEIATSSCLDVAAAAEPAAKGDPGSATTNAARWKPPAVTAFVAGVQATANRPAARVPQRSSPNQCHPSTRW